MPRLYSFTSDCHLIACRDRIRSLEDSNDRQESGIAAASQDLQQIRVLTANLKQASEQNRDMLKKIKDSTDQQDANNLEIHKKIDDSDKRIEQNQKELSESVAQLNKHIKEQREMAVANKAADVQQWTNLQLEVGEEREELDSLKSSQEQLQSGLDDSRKVLEGVSIMTENQTLKRLSERLGGTVKVLGVKGMFGSGKPKAKTEPTPVRQDGPPNRNPNTERRVYNTALPSSNQLPPRRNERTWSTCSAPVSRGKEPPEWGRRTIVIHPPPTMNTAQPTFQMGPVNHFQNHNQGQEMMEYLRHFQNLNQGQEMVELPPPLPTRPSGAPTVDSWLNTLPAASPLTKSMSRSTAMQSLLVTSTTPPPLPPRRTSDASTVLSSATSIRSALTSSRSSTVSSPSPSPSPAAATEPAKVFSVADLVAMIPKDRRPTGGTCCGLDFSQLLLAESLAASISSPNSTRLSVSSSSLKKPIPGPKPRSISPMNSSTARNDGESGARVSSVRQRAIDLESTLRF